MKWFLLVLVVANVIYFGWEFDRNSKMKIANTSQGISVSADVARLEKISELPEPLQQRNSHSLLSHEDANTERGELMDTLVTPGSGQDDELVLQLPSIDPALADDSPGIYTCFSFGPIPDNNKALALYDWFLSKNVFARIESSDEDTQRLYWIYLAPLASTVGAMSMLDNLKDKGISDYRLINKGELKNAISLGLFSSQGAVDNRLAELNRQGFKPVVVPYTNVRKVFRVWVRLLKGSRVLEEVFSGFPSGFNSIPVKCAESA